MSEHTAMQADVRALTNLYNQSREVAADLQTEVDQLRTELAAATARADALDVRCSAAERLATAASGAHVTRPPEDDVIPLTAELRAALDLWRRVDASHHGTRAHDYADAIIAAGWKPPGTTFDVCGHGRRANESCILCERVAP